ncbi:flagellar protein FlaJ [Natronoarchaeum philippinense]|uniref:Flagellar protein FlaJ n=1 Tax=Natronoarchaeum philippinense TaxID=558529 RepID=A0A285N557_NATPI|nr:type II secretion system F family protein [Natronoarchaeum philippinense]SNZ04458.1 flagellar protein FlaJ [Natronoarchaeum philippinense]
MAPYDLVPVTIAVLAVLPAALAPLSTRIGRIVSRLSLLAFGDLVHRSRSSQQLRKRRLRAAHVPMTYRLYAARTLLYATIGAVVGAVAGLYLQWGVARLLTVAPETVRAQVPGTFAFVAGAFGRPLPTGRTLLAIQLGSMIAVAAVGAVTTYYLRWWYPSQIADSRRSDIDENLPQTISFMYALSRSGMELPKVLRILAAHEHVYGEPAAEIGVAVRNIDMFGKDMVTAIRTMARRTPSPKFKEFAENLASVLQSGQSLAEFLEQQHQEYQQEAEDQQDKLLEELATLAEVYVTTLVVLPLFLITILVVVGITVTNTLTLLRGVVYVLLPVLNVGFILYLRSAMGGTVGNGQFDPSLDPTVRLDGIRRTESRAARSDGGVSVGESQQAANLERLQLYRRLKWLRESFGHPVQTIIERPTALLWATVPIIGLLTLVRLYASVRLGIPLVLVIDDFLLQATLFVVGTFAIAYEAHSRRIDTIEASVPDFLDRLASVNEAGMTVVESLDRVRKSDLGALNPELDRVWADIQWGADVEMALRRFEHRVRTRTISRVVTLITNAINASGDLARVLRIAATQAKSDRRLKRARRTEMLTYVVVVYVAFGVFLLIVGALDTVLIPNLPDDSVLPEASGAAGQFAITQVLEDLGSINESAYTLIFFHTTTLQALFSGLIAGQMSGGRLADGAKHASVLLSIAYLTFLFI